jgi:hypothetical protein
VAGPGRLVGLDPLRRDRCRRASLCRGDARARGAGVDLKISPATWFKSAGFLDQLEIRPAEVLLRVADLTYQMRPAKVLGMFLLGLWIGRRALFAATAQTRPLLRRMARFGFALGLPLAFVRAVLHMTAGETTRCASPRKRSTA